MKVGIVAEGSADVAVIRNILKGKLGIERKDTVPIRPALHEDKTDLALRKAASYRHQAPAEYSNWGLVLEACRARTSIEEFLQNQVAGASLVVIHIDTAEAHLPGYDIARPDRKDPDYGERLRAMVVAKLDALLGAELAADVRYAIAVEEAEAWVLTIHEDQDDRDTGTRGDPKKRLDYVLNSRSSSGNTREKKPRDEARGRKTSEYDTSHALSLAFSERGRLEECAVRNRSLRLFIDSLTLG